MVDKKIKGKGVYYALISTFVLLWLVVAFVSTLHAITFFQLTNAVMLSVLLGLAFEIGQATVLFSILMTENKNKLLAWTMMIFLTALQVTANVYASFKFMDMSGSNEWMYWQRAILFSVEAESTEMYKVIISWISGALLPLIALGMTSLVAENIKIMKERRETSEEVVNASDVISEISRVRLTDEELERLSSLIEKKEPMSTQTNETKVSVTPQETNVNELPNEQPKETETQEQVVVPNVDQGNTEPELDTQPIDETILDEEPVDEKTPLVSEENENSGEQKTEEETVPKPKPENTPTPIDTEKLEKIREMAVRNLKKK